jgi:bacterial/archaeal transporter family-2 protein
MHTLLTIAEAVGFFCGRCGDRRRRSGRRGGLPLVGGVALMQWWPVGFTLFAASLLPVQAACASALNRALARPGLVVLVSLTVSLLATTVVGGLSGRLALPDASRFAAAPWWAWGAGLCGAVFLFSQPVVVPRLGVAMYISLVVSAQIAAALALDHFGALSLPQHPASLGRILGALLMVAGVALVARS